jgi:glycosyltransferase involved in cell wall biosynthesis
MGVPARKPIKDVISYDKHIFMTELEPSGKRILYVITKASWGGAQRYVYDLAVAAKERGYETAVAYGADGLLRTKLEEAGIRTITLSTLTRDINVKAEWESFKTLRALIKEERPDIIHVNSSKAGLALLAARLERVPHIIFTAHGWAFNEKRPWWQKIILRCIYIATIYLARTTICVSDATRRDFNWFLGSSCKTIKHGINAPLFLAKDEARAKLLPGVTGGVWLGMIAELHPTKRVQDAIDALAELASAHPELRLIVMGDGELKEWLAERIRHYHLEERVHLVGFVGDAEQYLKAFDMFLMPSRTEALGLALIEAGYAGLPAIAARAGGIPEIVRHKKTGLLVPTENPHALARAIRTLLEYPDEAAAYAAAFETETRKNFSKERMLTETFALYES